MDIEQAKMELESAKRNLRGCANEVERTSREWLKAESASRANGRMHHRLRGQYGDNYRKRLNNDWEGARRAFDEARARKDKAKAVYDKAAAANDADASDQGSPA